MNFTITTTRGNVVITTTRIPCSQFFNAVGEVCLAWVAIPACRFDRLVGEVRRNGRVVKTCLVRCCGMTLYRERATGQEVFSTAAIEEEIRGQLVPAPRSSREVSP